MKSPLYAFFRFCADLFDRALWRLFPEQQQNHQEEEINRLIASIFPNGVCQNCVNHEHKEGE